MSPDRRDPVREGGHLVAEPGAKRVLCGLRSNEVPTTWARWIGNVEVGHMWSGFPLPAWCPECLVGLHKCRRMVRRPTANGQATLFDAPVRRKTVDTAPL